MDDTPIPLIPLPVVNWLRETFPNECPGADVPEHEKCAKAGEQRVVRLVSIAYDRQQNGEDTD